MQLKKLMILLVLSNLLVACGQTVYIQPRLPLPEPVDVPKINKKEFTCVRVNQKRLQKYLSEQEYITLKTLNSYYFCGEKMTFVKLVKRDAIQKARIKRLRAIIETTRKK